jgi:hypothetical protein
VTDCTDPLCVYRAAQLDRLLSDVNTFANAALRVELQEARETIDRLNAKIIGRNHK